MAVKTNNYGALQEELDQILTWFQDSSDSGIDESLAKYERALVVIEELKKQINEAKNTITKLNQKFGL